MEGDNDGVIMRADGRDDGIDCDNCLSLEFYWR